MEVRGKSWGEGEGWLNDDRKIRRVVGDLHRWLFVCLFGWLIG